MYIMTNHFSLLAISGSDGAWTQVTSLTPADGQIPINIDPSEVADIEARQLSVGARGMIVPSGRLAGYEFVKADAEGAFNLFMQGFVCAPPGETRVVRDRKLAADWERFRFVTAEAAASYFRVSDQRGPALEARVKTLVSEQRPVCLHFGCGFRRIKGFLNIDKFTSFGDPEDYFLFDFAEKAWPIPDCSVDYIYSEDFIEHIPQRNQVAFLAEAFRVLKMGSCNRVSTPCLADSMRTNSDFSKGFNGVFFEEFDKWGHVCIFTRGLMSDLASAIGYRQVFFTAKSRGSSPHAVIDRRPGGDRSDLNGNLFADLIK
jgi:predicted SAM-dependent methyltransferase